MSSYWSKRLVTDPQELGHLVGDSYMFVYMCFLKHDPKSKEYEKQKLNCMTWE